MRRMLKEVKMTTAMVRVLVAVVSAIMFSLPVSAAPIGELNITGDLSVGQTTIDFLPPAGTGFGFFNIEASSTGDFAALGTDGLIRDLDMTAQPVGVPFLLPAFISFPVNVNPNIVFDLTFIEPGVFGTAQLASPPAPGQTATPPGSPFNLVNTTSDSSVASFTVRGVARDLSDGSSLPFIGVFTSQFSSQSYQELLAVIAAGGTVDKSYSATFTVIPEPGALSIMVIGLIGLAGVRRRSV